jgi:uncharacterized membrane protein YbaN (DUF454 family)
MRPLKKPAKIVLIVLGTLCVVLGLIGILLPVLPTTPFLLLAAASYARSSDRFYDWLLNNRWFGTYIRNYREGKGATLHHKITALVLLWGTIGYSAIFIVSLWWVRLILFIIATAVTFHLAKMPTYRPEK